MNQVSSPSLNEEKSDYHMFGWCVCGLAAVFYAYEYLLRIAPSVMTTDLMRTFGIGAGEMAFLVASYYYAYTPAQFVVGVLLDRYGPRRMLTLACLTCALGTWIFAVTTDTMFFWIGRFLMGFGSAFAFCGVLKLATIWLPPHRFALVAGLNSALGTVGAMFGVVVMADLVQTHGWRATSYSGVTIGLILSVILYLLIRDAPAGKRHVVEKVHTIDVLRSLLKILMHPQMWVCGLVGCLMYLPTSAFAELWANPYFQVAHGFSAHDSALVVLCIFFGFTIGGPLNGFLSDHFKIRCKPLLWGSFASAIVVTIILYVPDLSKTTVMALSFLFGLLYGAQIIVFAIGKEISPANASGTAIAVTNGLVMIGGMIFQPAIGVILDRLWSGQIENDLRVYSASDYQYAMLVLPIALVVSGLFTFALKETHARISVH